MKKSIWILLFVLIIKISQAQFSGGSGSYSDPYIIENATDMDNIRNYPYASFKLKNDISLYDYTPYSVIGQWEPIEFYGYFDGNGYTISDLFVQKFQNAGLFGRVYNDAHVINLSVKTIEDLHLSGVFGEVNVGVLIGYAEGGVRINNCHVSGSVDGFESVGGLIGNSEGYIEILNSSANVSINIKDAMDNYSKEIGGLIGKISDGNILNCYVDGHIIGNENMGGFIGLISNCNHIVIHYCYSIIRSNLTNCGGFIGNSYAANLDLNSNYYNAFRNFGYPLGAIPLQYSDMIQSSSYIGWDFINTWYIEEGVSYPKLRNTIPVPIVKYAFEYSYDNCGNRIQRKVITLNTSSYKSLAITNSDANDSSEYQKPFIDSQMNIKIYPNPTKGELKVNLEIQQEEIQDIKLDLFNSNGIKIFSQPINGNNTDLNISNQPSGIYILKINLNGKISEWKIIKQ